MRFSKIIGKIDSNLVDAAEKVLSKVFLDLGLRYDNEGAGSKLGGDPLIFSLIYPVEHVCTLNIATAATDGKRYYWNPKFVLKVAAKNKVGLRIVSSHEAWHAIYMHPQRRGSRIPKLWNIAVDYIVNGIIMEDFKARHKDPHKLFTENLGKYMTLDQYAELLKDPFKTVKGLEDVDVLKSTSNSKMKMPKPDENRDLTAEEIKELEKRNTMAMHYYADPNLPEDLRRPEKIYEFLYKLLPKCSTCGKVGMYKIPKKKSPSDPKDQKEKAKKPPSDPQNPSDKESDSQSDQQSDQANQHSHQHGNNGQPCNCPHNCDECGDSFDIFDFGNTVDDHMDASESEEQMAKKLANAIEATKRMAGHVPAGLEEELGRLTQPKITWQDIIRARILKARNGNGRNDWTRFRSRPMFSGMLIPKRKSYCADFGCLVDTSGSMSKDDIAFGISQLQSLDEKNEGTITCADAQIYWDQSLKIKKASSEELNKIKIVGRGGTVFADYFSDYKKKIGHCDFLIIISDLYLVDQDVASMKDPGVDVFWLCTSSNTSFNPPFGKVLQLRD